MSIVPGNYRARKQKWHDWWTDCGTLLRPVVAMDLVQLLGEDVRWLRKLKGMSHEELSLRADMKRSYVSDLERGTRNPSVRALGRLAEALGVEPGSLLRAEE